MKIKFIKPNYEINMLNQTGVEKLQHIERVARTCYKTEDKITDASYIKLIKHLVDKEHHAMLEFAHIHMKFTVSRAFTHEMVRHRMASFAQESQRYVGYGGAIEFIIPTWCNNIFPDEFDSDDSEYICSKWDNYTQAEIYWAGSMITAADMYNSLILEGWRPEQARDVLPNACKTEINVQANLREWMHIFDLRAHPAAAPQMREMMIPALAELKELIPIVFDDI